MVDMPSKFPLKTSDALEMEAASWMAQLDNGPLSPTDKLALAEWTNRSPKHAQILRHYAKVWDGIDVAIDEVLLTSKPVTLTSILKSWFVIRPMHFMMSASAILALFITAVFVFQSSFMSPHKDQFYVYQVEKGEKYSQTLTDGSVIHLNTDSVVEVKYTDESRVLRLLRGEAFFEVAHDPSRPFDVYAGEGRVQALGTAFSVKLDGDTVDIIVTEGKVRFDRVKDIAEKTLAEVEQSVKIDTPIFMEAGQTMALKDETQKLTNIDEARLKKEFAWRNGEMIFSGDTLEFVVNHMNRYSDKAIVISDLELRSFKISGTFKSDNIDVVLEALESAYDIKVQNGETNVVYLSK